MFYSIFVYSYETRKTVAMNTRIPIDSKQAQTLLEKKILGKPENVSTDLMNLLIGATKPFMLKPGADMRSRVLQLLVMLACKDPDLPDYDFPGRDEFAKFVQDFVSESDDVLSSDGTSSAFRFQTSSDLTSQGWTAPTHNDTGTTPRVCDDDTVSS